MDPVVSLVVLNFNGRTWLSGCLDALAAQQGAAAEAATGVRFGDGFIFGTVLPGGSRRWTIGANPTITDRHRFQRLGAANDGTSLAHQRAR